MMASLPNHPRRGVPMNKALAVAVVLLGALATGFASDKETVLHTFTFGSGDGNTPFGGLVADAAGNLYGTTAGGGLLNGGTVFELSPASGGWTETILYSFPSMTYPYSSLIFDAAGNLYGTTYQGGAHGGGSAFELSPAAGGGWTETTIYSFGGVLKGATDTAGPPVVDSSGNLYGIAGGGLYGGGMVYKLTPSASGNWTETDLYDFNGFPYGNLILDSAGNIYGATEYGQIFELTPSSYGTYPAILYAFTGGTDGADPRAGLTWDAEGNLYGTTTSGGPYGYGVVFKLTPKTHGGWRESTIHAFTGGADGANPAATLTFDAAGNLYGTALLGGAHGYGTVFKLTHGPLGGWIEGTLHAFTGGSDGSGPISSVMIDSGGNIYGTTGWGGSTTTCSGSGCGVVYELSPTSTAR